MFLALLSEEFGSMSWGEKLSTSGLTFVVGMVLTFVILALLVGLVFLCRVIVAAIERGRESRSGKKAENLSVSEPQQEEEDFDAETVAAITAAVSCCLAAESEDGKPAPFRIRAIRRR